MLTKTIKYLIFGLAFYFCHLTSFAQNKNIDSLLTLIKKDKADTNKVIHSYKLCWEYKNIGLYDTALHYGNAALQLAQQLNFKGGIADSYNFLGSIYLGRTNYPKALDYYLKALKMAEETGYKKLQTSALCNIGLVYSNSADYSKALKYYLKALKMAEESGYKQIQTNALLNIGAAYNSQGDYLKALDYDLKSLKMAEELKDKNGINTSLGNIGQVYYNQGDYAKASDYYFKALKISEELGDKNAIAIHLGNIGIIYKDQKDDHKALDYFHKALKVAEELGDKNRIAIQLGNIGDIYDEKKDYSKALEYNFKALKMAEEAGDKNSIAAWLGNIGLLYTKTGKFKEAEQYLLRTQELFNSIGSMDYVMQSEEALSHLYDTTGRYKLALEHYKKSVALRDSIFSQENKKQLVRKEMNYEFDKKTAAINAENEKQQAIAEEKSRKQKIIIWSVALGLLIMLVFAGFIFRSLRITSKQKKLIEAQKNEVTRQKEVAESQRIIAEELFEVSEKQKELVDEKNKEITDSINYAKRIQQAKLPKKEEIYTALPQSFILFKPKDIVSGDFYFFHKKEKLVFIAAADCTGHGVPGAFMSMIGSEKLEDAVMHSSNTSEILSLLNKGIKTALKQSESDESTRDGMDIAFCSVDTENGIVKYAGANRPIWVVRKGQTEIEETKATKKAIGGFTEEKQHFDTHELKLQQGDTFYIFTDGYADQFGGEEGKKLMTKKFKEILLDIQDKTIQEQEKYLDTFAGNWRGKMEQIDDILVIGVRL